MAEVLPEVETFVSIKVIGVGGAGGAAIERMMKSKVQGVEFIAVNTDAQALHFSHAPYKVHIGRSTTRGLGAGADPGVGRKAAEESETEIQEALKGADMVFITAGMGGGTGGGAAPLIASLAKETGALVIGIVTKPFSFEGEKRRSNADVGIGELKDNVDTLITIPNDRLLQMIDRKTSLLDAFKVVDEVLQQGVQGISDLITVHGQINLDFADVRAIMSNAGSALMGIGRASGENRSIEAARQAIDSPLLEISIEGARGVLFNITGGTNMTMYEINEAAKTITDAVHAEANIIFGAVLDESMVDEIKITVVATGFEPKKRERRLSEPVVAAPAPTPAAAPFRAPEPVVEEPAFVQTTVADKRTPFINEKPQIFPDLDRPVIPNPSVQPIEPEIEAVLEDLSPIEPEPEEEYIEVTTQEVKAVRDEPFGFEVAQNPVSKPSVQFLGDDSKDQGDDDLDIPTFIRRKVDE